MQTELADFIRDTHEGREAEAILRRCVHCGFCNATCPTYQLLGDELDGPRGRIYLIKQALEGEPVSAATQLHLDRCLTCRACETTCPSGVEYGRLADIGRAVVEQQVERGPWDQARRLAIALVLPRPRAFAALLALGRAVRALLPRALAAKVPLDAPPDPGSWPAARHARRMLALAGCVQPALDPGINAAAARLLDRLGISLIEAPPSSKAGCCGALRFHINFQEEGLNDMRRLIDAWWPQVERGKVEAIVMTASGCGVTVREYGRLLAHDPAYRDKAARISGMTRDLSEVLFAEREALRALYAARPMPAGGVKAAFHAPCSLQHGQKLRGLVEALLADAGYELTPVPDAHLCCGSAGTYSLLQPELSEQLKRNKLAALRSGGAEVVFSANIGCQNHLAGESVLPVRHWIAALDRHLTPDNAQGEVRGTAITSSMNRTA
jgi:glycolate oxidase iron-sulfur subunit